MAVKASSAQEPAGPGCGELGATYQQRPTTQLLSEPVEYELLPLPSEFLTLSGMIILKFTVRRLSWLMERNMISAA